MTSLNESQERKQSNLEFAKHWIRTNLDEHESMPLFFIQASLRQVIEIPGDIAFFFVSNALLELCDEGHVRQFDDGFRKAVSNDGRSTG